MAFLKTGGTLSVKWQYQFPLSGTFWGPSLSQIYWGIYTHPQRISRVQFVTAEVLFLIHKDKQAYLFASIFTLLDKPLRRRFQFLMVLISIYEKLRFHMI